MSVEAGRHPSDAQRAQAAIGVLREAIRAAGAGDRGALAACYADEVVWLDDGAAHRGPDDAATAHLALARGATWDPPQQQGAKAALRLTSADGRRRALVVEVRRARIVFAATA